MFSDLTDAQVSSLVSSSFETKNRIFSIIQTIVLLWIEICFNLFSYKVEIKP